MNERELCGECGGNGVVKIPGGIRVCPKCNGECWAPNSELTALRARVKELEAEKNGAYSERDQLVCALSKVWPSHLARHSDADTAWDNDWRWIVCIHSPAGQLTWHIHDSERGWFEHLDVREGDWDGHTTPEKYRRLASLLPDARIAQVLALLTQALNGWGAYAKKDVEHNDIARIRAEVRALLVPQEGQ